uniref:DNA polymerase n=1 Tax=Salmonella sp. SAL4457 TaxID=3159912 RepID=UPI00397B4606
WNESPKELLEALLRRKYRGYIVYAHNLSKFDLIFLFKYLAKLWMFDGYKVTPIFKDGAAISIVVTNNNGVSLTFRDSYLILPSSLKTLAETFKTNQKLIEPVL